MIYWFMTCISSQIGRKFHGNIYSVFMCSKKKGGYCILSQCFHRGRWFILFFLQKMKIQLNLWLTASKRTTALSYIFCKKGNKLTHYELIRLFLQIYILILDSLMKSAVFQSMASHTAAGTRVAPLTIMLILAYFFTKVIILIYKIIFQVKYFSIFSLTTFLHYRRITN